MYSALVLTICSLLMPWEIFPSLIKDASPDGPHSVAFLSQPSRHDIGRFSIILYFRDFGGFSAVPP